MSSDDDDDSEAGYEEAGGGEQEPVDGSAGTRESTTAKKVATTPWWTSSVRQEPEPLSPRYRGRVRKCPPATGATVFIMNRVRTSFVGARLGHERFLPCCCIRVSAQKMAADQHIYLAAPTGFEPVSPP